MILRTLLPRDESVLLVTSVATEYRVIYCADSRRRSQPQYLRRQLPMFRLRKKHSPNHQYTGPSPDAARILAQQSVGRAVAGGIMAVLVCGWLWATVSMQTGRVFPWFSVLFGAMIGLAVRRSGRGLDWRFPVIAAVLAWAGAYAGNLMIGIVETGRYIEAGALSVLVGLSGDTMENFFANTVNPIDHIYALCAAGMAAFLAKRRVNRRQVLAIRTMEREEN